MKTMTTQPTTIRIEVTSPVFGSQPGLPETTCGAPLPAFEMYSALFRKFHPPANPPEPARGWRWVDYGVEIYSTLFRKFHPPANAPEPARGWRWADYGDPGTTEAAA